jgi:acetyl esterase
LVILDQRVSDVKSLIIYLVGAALVLCLLGYTAFQVSPWPAAYLVRRGMDKGGIAIAQALEKHVSASVVGRLNEHYDETDTDAYLDIFMAPEIAASTQRMPTIVWMHGGGWLSGSKEHVANYLKILAMRGYTTVGVDYSLAPGKVYPTPVRQLNAALAYLTKNAAKLHVDPSNIILAGDSAGAQIAAQLAAIITAPAYAQEVGIVPSIDSSRLRGVVLYCGIYDGERIQIGNSLRTIVWSNIRTVFWSYIGTKDFQNDPKLLQFSVARHITADFPPMFISVGNADKAAPQSYLLAEAAAAKGVSVDRLFFPETHAPPLWHEYQFDLDSEAGQVALERSLQFLASRLHD